MKNRLLYVMLGFTGILNAQSLYNGLQACYPLDGNASNNAATGSQLDGVFNNITFVAGHTGTPNNAFQFSGDTTSYVTLPNDARIRSKTFSISGWFNNDSLPFQQYLIFTKNNCNSNFEAYSLSTIHDVGAGQQVFRISKSNSSCAYDAQIQSTTAPVVGQWYHVAFSMDSVNMQLYINGVLEASAPVSSAVDYGPGRQVILAGTRESFNAPFHGRIDNLRFYNRILTGTEVASLHADSTPCRILSPVASFSVSKNPACTKQTISFTDQSTNVPTAWNWQFPGGSPATATVANPSCSFSIAGIYSVTLVSSNAGGASNTAIQTVTISICTALNQLTDGNLQAIVYPNPSNGLFVVEHPGDVTVNVTDNLGRNITVGIAKVSENKTEIDLSSCMEGIYFVHIADPVNGRMQYFKMTLIK